MKIILSILLIMTAFASNALAGSATQCSTSDGKIQYKYQGYQGGMAPRHGMVTATYQVVVNGVVISESKQFAGAASTVAPIAHELLDQIEIDSESGPAHRARYYAATLKLTRTEATDSTTFPIKLPYSGWVLCLDTFLAIP